MPKRTVVFDTTNTQFRLDKFRTLTKKASRRSTERIADDILRVAKDKAPKFTRELADSGHREPVVVKGTTSSTNVVFDAPYAKFVENGFAGHFVPFHVAPSLYLMAVSQWGWRVARPDEIKKPKQGFLYLIPPNSTRPRYGVRVNGDAQPFLRPAVRELKEKHKIHFILERTFKETYRAGR
jgi:hypothetical protein